MRTKQPAQLDGLTGIRGVAAIWVALHHLQAYVPGPRSPLELPGIKQLSRDGWLAVDLFFVLSGFIMMHVHGDEFATVTFARARRFVALRFARIYPVHFVVLLMHLPLLLAAMSLGLSYSPQAFTARSFSGVLQSPRIESGATMIAPSSASAGPMRISTTSLPAPAESPPPTPKCKARMSGTRAGGE